MPRYVILRHETPPGYVRPTHWDLMLESGGVLRTWALADEPKAGAAIEAESLPDHRLDYLDFEGAVSGRGSVSRFDSGEHTLDDECESRLVVRLDGARFQGTLQLERRPDDSRRWLAQFPTE